MRVATFAAPLSRDSPGLLLRDIQDGDDAQIQSIIAIIDHIAPDVLLLSDMDYDAGLIALDAFNRALDAPFPHLFALPPNSGMATGLDLDGDGRTGDARDAQGYGRFFGDGGLAILTRYAVDEAKVQDFSALLWRDLPGATLPVVDGKPFPSEAAISVQRLSSTGHWAVPLMFPDGGRMTVLAYSATPPVFDGPEDRNGLRNRDELGLWLALLDGQLGDAPTDHFVLVGNANLDPVDGSGLTQAMAAALSDVRLQDPLPKSRGGELAQSEGHFGDPALDTADWPETGPGNLRVSYVLPSSDWRVADAGVFWPAPDTAEASLLGDDGLAAGPHHLVWVDLVR